MSNIKNIYHKNLKLKLSNYGFWDFYLSDDEGGVINNPCGELFSGDCSVVYYDFNNENIYTSGTTSANTINSLFHWNGGFNSGYTLDTIGLTGLDNGLVPYHRLSGDLGNEELFSTLTNSVLIINSGSTKLQLNSVSGYTGNYTYPIEIVNDTTYGNYAKLCGGFYQGFYKIDGTNYEVLPKRFNGSWNVEFWLRKSDNCVSGSTILNDLYPDNKGIFFYIGTRAENKYWNVFNGLNTGCTSGCTEPLDCDDTITEFCTPSKETDISIFDDSFGVEIPLSPPRVDYSRIYNEFLIYGRAGSGIGFCRTCGTSDGLGRESVCTYDGNGVVVGRTHKVVSNHQNPFLIYGRAGSGIGFCRTCGTSDGLGRESVCTFSGFTEDVLEIDYNKDTMNNALAFIIKDDGSIGYRLLTYTATCVDNTTISGITKEEQFSPPSLITENEWHYVVVRYYDPSFIDGCELDYTNPRKGKLMFYVDGKLKFVVHNFKEFMARNLNEHWKKQVGVPFNISIGGGTQGLLESITFDGQDPADIGLPIEYNFAGSFIGDISQFKLNLCDLNWCDIQCRYKNEMGKYKI